jgi:hypothetical protein
MAYSTKAEVALALANALSQGSPSTPAMLVPITSIGNKLSDSVTNDQMFQYIRWADQQIDAALSALYRTPLKRVNLGSYALEEDAITGDTSLIIADTSRFIEGDTILIRDDDNEQAVAISAVPNVNTLTLADPLLDSYLASNTSIEYIRFPDPIPLISARLAAATIYDKHFAAQVQGNQSDFGKALRAKALEDLNLVLSGVLRLDVADAGDYVGRRYYDPSLDDVISIRAKPEEFFKGQQ